MNKIKKMFSGMINSVKEAIDMFPLTTLIVFALTVIATFLIIGADFSESVEEMIAHIWVIGVFTAFGSFLSESLFSDKKDIKRIIGYVISLVIAIIFDRLIDSEVIEEVILARWVSLYVTVCFFLAVYLLIKRAGLDFEKYSLNLVLNVKRASIIYGIVAIGFLILYAIFVTLILEDADFELYLRLLCLFTGFYYVPVVLKAFGNEDAEDTKFNRAVFSKVLLPLLLVAMLIVYIYLVKIFLVTEVPKNQLFSILSMIFVFVFPIYVINKNYMEKGSFIDKVNRAIPYLFTQFIFLQVYSMGIRIKEYGLTESRYMAIVLIVFEVIAIALAVVKNSKYLKEILLANIAISVVVLVSPFNFEDMPLLSQKKIVDRYVAEGKEFDSLTEYDKKKFAGAYQFIEDEKDLINPALSQLEKEKLSSYNSYRYSYDYSNDSEDRERYVSLYKKLNGVNIADYNKVYELPYTYSDNGTIIEYNGDNLYSNYAISVSFNVDLDSYIKNLIENYEISSATAQRVFEEQEYIKIDETKDLYLTEIGFSYTKSSKKIDSVRIEGFVLEK